MSVLNGKSICALLLDPIRYMLSGAGNRLYEHVHLCQATIYVDSYIIVSIMFIAP